MNIPSEPLKWDLAHKIQDALTKLGVENTQAEIYNALGAPPQLSMGHMAFACFPYAKILRKSPAQIAKDLGELIEPGTPIGEVLPTGPYLNFNFSTAAMGASAIQPILNGDFFNRELTRDTPKTMVEYSQPNTHKELHVGHMRNMCLGDCLIRVNKYCGYDIISATFPGDVGTHVAKCLWYLKYRNTEPIPETGKGAWLGNMYTRANAALEEEDNPENKEILTAILKELEAGEGEYFDLWKETREWSIKLMKEVYEWIGIDFDIWYWESEVDAASAKLAREYYEKGIFIESKGAIGMDLSAENLGFAMILKSDGTGLYLTKDIELARRKFDDYQIERNIYIVDQRQSHHFSQVFTVLDKMGFENAKNCYHLAYNFVELPDGAMSSRKGNIIPISDLTEQMSQSVIDEHLNAYRGDWPDEEIQNTADILAKGAIKYGMLRIDTTKKIVFEMKQWLRKDGESGPYIQYTATRINSMTTKLNYSPDAEVDWSTLQEDEEKFLMVKMAQFNDVIVGACTSYQSNQICVYLYDLAKQFNTFYNAHSIKQTEDPILKNTRLALSKAVSVLLTKGLDLLGVEVPNRM